MTLADFTGGDTYPLCPIHLFRIPPFGLSARQTSAGPVAKFYRSDSVTGFAGALEVRTADDFNAYYANPDPWGVARARFRDKVLRARLTRAIRNKRVLELGCGEGHLTQAIFYRARSVTGVDISDVAIARAKSLNLRNANFETADLLDASFGGYDVIVALECIHYLSHQEQGAFLAMVASEHSGKMLFLSGPIIDYQKHFGHRRLMLEFRALGFRILGFHNLSVYWHPLSYRIVGELLKLPLGYRLLDWLPERMIYQRLYALRAP